MHVFNTDHPAYALDLWDDIVKNIAVIKKGFEGELDGFDLSMLKRQLYHMTFLDQNPNDPFEVIAYNDSERLDQYGGLSKAFTEFQNSGLPEFANMSFEEFLRYPNWFVDWLVTHWSRLVRSTDSSILDKALEKEVMQIEKDQQKNNVADPFKNY